MRQAVPVIALTTAMVGLFVAAELGQQRIAASSRRVETAALRHRVLAEVLQLLTAAESGQRGYVLLGDPSYLAPYEESAPKLAKTLHTLDEVYVTADERTLADIGQIKSLANEKLAEMAETLEFYRGSERKAALDLIRSDLGKQTMRELTGIIRRVQYEETTKIVDASRSWRGDIWVTRGISGGALVLNVFLLLMVRRLVLRAMRNRESEADELAERRAHLEQVVEHRTQELSSLSTHLQSVAEREKSALARELHDELGGLLIAARMDVSWLEDRLASDDPDVQSRFERLHAALQTGIDVKRRVVEDLRPTLLDNLGLFPALRWQVADACERGGLRCAESYPEQEPSLTPEASIAIFRVVQESLTNILKHAQARNVEVSIESEAGWLIVRVCDDGVGLPAERRRAIGSHGLAAMRHRVVGLGGLWSVLERPAGGVQIVAKFPFDRIGAAS